MIALTSGLLVIAGVLILVASIFTTRRLIAGLGASPVRRHWRLMLGLIAVFVAGYLGYAWFFWNTQREPLDLIVPAIFFFGACFVWLAAILSLETAVVVLRIGQLERENVADPLTGVFNRRHLERRLSEEVARARRHALPLSVLLLDIDHFKKINDSHGHQAGDEALTHFARQVQSQLREPDLLARYGGEEFMVVAPGTSLEGALALAERVRERLESTALVVAVDGAGQRDIRLTCSIGVASLGGALDRGEALIHVADECLYRAKREGRNRVGAPVPV